LIGLSTVLVIFFGGVMLVNGTGNVTVGNIAEFVIYVNKLTWPFASLGWITSQVQQAAASMTRINEFLDTKPAITSVARSSSATFRSPTMRPTLRRCAT